MTVEIIVPYARRPRHLLSFLSWVRHTQRANLRITLVHAAQEADSAVEEACGDAGVGYLWFFHRDGAFCKSAVLNAGLASTKARFVMPLDVDLVPIGDTLLRHVATGATCEGILVTGYRIMSLPGAESMGVSDAVRLSAVAPEDMPTALRKHLLERQRFGIAPMFHAESLRAIGGWDEQYVGWGAEDQDVIERYLGTSKILVRSPDLLYLHLYHADREGWGDSDLTTANRLRYHARRQARLCDQAKGEVRVDAKNSLTAVTTTTARGSDSTITDARPLKQNDSE